MDVRRWEPWLIGSVSLLLTLLPTLVINPAYTGSTVVSLVFLVTAGLTLVFWRRQPLPMVCAAALLLGLGALPYDPPAPTLLVCTVFAFVAGYSFGGRAAWTSAAAVLAWLAAMYLLTGERDAGLVMFTIPGFIAGTALRLRRETADELALRGQELEAERELFAQLSVQNERARIAAELHDIIGHSLSVMVVQAAAGQRLLQGNSPDALHAGTDALAVVAESARQGRDDLARLIALLGGQEVASPDLALVDEVVSLAAASGLQVACRFEGDRDGVSAAVAATAFRVVRESLTNALRHAPGAAVQVCVRGTLRALEVRVENAAPTASSDGIIGTGHGLRGLRDLVDSVGGRLTAGRTTAGGWLVEALIPNPS